MSGRGRLRSMPLHREAGKRASESSASTSVHAFSLPRITACVSCRVTDVAASQLLVDAQAPEQRVRERFPGMRSWRPSARYTRVRSRDHCGRSQFARETSRKVISTHAIERSSMYLTLSIDGRGRTRACTPGTLFGASIPELGTELWPGVFVWPTRLMVPKTFAAESKDCSSDVYARTLKSQAAFLE
jgi:hypothetical protein